MPAFAQTNVPIFRARMDPSSCRCTTHYYHVHFSKKASLGTSPHQQGRTNALIVYQSRQRPRLHPSSLAREIKAERASFTWRTGYNVRQRWAGTELRQTCSNGTRWRAVQWLENSAEQEVAIPVEKAFEMWEDRERIPQWMPWITSVKACS